MTKLLVLGLLDGGPMSGYDLQQKLGGADAERWGGVLPGSIYHALKKLEGEGCIALAGVEQTGHRQKAVYRITEAGRNHLHTLIADALRASSALYPTTLFTSAVRTDDSVGIIFYIHIINKEITNLASNNICYFL